MSSKTTLYLRILVSALAAEIQAEYRINPAVPVR